MLNFFGLDLTGVVPPVENFPINKKKGEVYTVDLGSIIHWYLTGQLHPYQHNRGMGLISKLTAESAEAGVKPDIIGECTIGFWDITDEDGNAKKAICLNNFHSRLYGFLKRYKAGNMTAKELATKVSVRVQDDFIGGYQGLNPLSTGHQTKHMMSCPDLAFGSHIQEIFDAIGRDVTKCIGNSRWTVLSSVLYNFTLPNPKWFWPDVYSKRMVARLRANDRKNTLPVDPADKKKIVQAIQFWYSMMMELGKEGIKDAKKVQGSAGFFGYVICDQLSKTPGFSKDQSVNIKRIKKEIVEVVKFCPDLCRANRPDAERFTLDADKIFKGVNGPKQRDEERLPKRETEANGDDDDTPSKKKKKAA